MLYILYSIFILALIILCFSYITNDFCKTETQKKKNDRLFDIFLSISIITLIAIFICIIIKNYNFV
jgi:bacteriorhodopsin